MIAASPSRAGGCCRPEENPGRKIQLLTLKSLPNGSWKIEPNFRGNLPAPRAGMEAIMGLFEALLVDVSVDLGGGDVGVAEHFLDDAEVATIVEQVAGKAVPQRVRRDVFRDAGAARVFLDEHPDGFPAERLASGREKHFADAVRPGK